MRYAGSAVEQARCLLRHVNVGGGLESRPLPGVLEQLVGTPVSITPAQLLLYLQAQRIRAEDVGGDIAAPLSRTAQGHEAAYFVIHDTSTPNLRTRDFPPDINEASWSYNSLARWQQGEQSIAHLFIARTGVSATAREYSMPWRATKAESCILLEPSRGLFLHHELIQPRKSDPAGRPGNDRLAPGAPWGALTPAQLDRLALAYIVASVRKGQWLVPAFHAAIDEGIGDGHDDPQGFDLADWTSRIDAILGMIQSGR